MSSRGWALVARCLKTRKRTQSEVVDHPVENGVVARRQATQQLVDLVDPRPATVLVLCNVVLARTSVRVRRPFWGVRGVAGSVPAAWTNAAWRSRVRTASGISRKKSLRRPATLLGSCASSARSTSAPTGDARARTGPGVRRQASGVRSQASGAGDRRQRCRALTRVVEESELVDFGGASRHAVDPFLAQACGTDGAKRVKLRHQRAKGGRGREGGREGRREGGREGGRVGGREGARGGALRR